MANNCIKRTLIADADADTLHRLGYIDVPISKMRFLSAPEGMSVGFNVVGGDGKINNLSEGRISSWSTGYVTGSTGRAYFEKYRKAGAGITSLNGVDTTQFYNWLWVLEYNDIKLDEGELIDFDGNFQMQGGAPQGTIEDLAKYTKLKGMNFTGTHGGNTWEANAPIVALSMPSLEVLQTKSAKWADITITRDPSYPIICLQKVANAFPNMSAAKADEYLIAMAQCAVGERYKYIQLAERTSASDAAVATLTSKGYTVAVG